MGLISCQQCGAPADNPPGTPLSCARCGARIGVLSQLEQCLAAWYEPRRWRADLLQPSPYYLLERLWTANGRAERLYRGLAPKHTNFDVFRFTLTRAIGAGLEEGWAELRFPADPVAEDPTYELEIRDADRFATEVERLLPDVDWSGRVNLLHDA